MLVSLSIREKSIVMYVFFQKVSYNVSHQYLQKTFVCYIFASANVLKLPFCHSLQALLLFSSRPCLLSVKESPSLLRCFVGN